MDEKKEITAPAASIVAPATVAEATVEETAAPPKRKRTCKTKAAPGATPAKKTTRKIASKAAGTTAAETAHVSVRIAGGVTDNVTAVSKKSRVPRKKKESEAAAPAVALEASETPTAATSTAPAETMEEATPAMPAETAETAVTAPIAEEASPSPVRKKILLVGAEVMPFAATGGLGDVMGSLPVALKAKYGEDADVRVVSPLYESISPEIHAAMKTEAVFTVRLAWRQQYCGILSLQRGGVTFYFVDNEYYFKRGQLYGHFDDGERYAYFCKAVMDMMPQLNFFPDILHANDWQSALSVVYLATEYKRRGGGYENIRSVFTIHNIEYQGKYSFDILGDVFDISDQYKPMMAYDGCINLVKAAIVCADRVTTVSETYAREIMTPEYSHRLHFILEKCADKVRGILNGIDTVYYNPAADADIPFAYTAENPSGKREDKLAFQREFALPEDGSAPIISVITRLATHKGIDLIAAVVRQILDSHPRAQFVLLGTGEGNYEAFFRQLEADYHDRARCFIKYNRALSKKIYAASDIFLMPSRSEPCGLSQMIACRYGALPVVRETGGLFDSIQPYYEDQEGLHGNGFTFANYSAEELAERTSAALALYERPDIFAALRYRAMTTDFSWDVSAGRYMDMYQNM